LNEQGEVTRNKADLLLKVTVNKKAFITLKLFNGGNHGIILYQMDVKSAFLNGVIEEVFVKQPPGFEDLKNPDHVSKLKKSLYGLKQAPRAWYDRLSNFLIKNDFKRGQVDTTLFRRTLEKDTLVMQIYVDDIIFGSTNASLCKELS